LCTVYRHKCPFDMQDYAYLLKLFGEHFWGMFKPGFICGLPQVMTNDKYDKWATSGDEGKSCAAFHCVVSKNPTLCNL